MMLREGTEGGDITIDKQSKYIDTHSVTLCKVSSSFSLYNRLPLYHSEIKKHHQHHNDTTSYKPNQNKRAEIQREWE